MPRAVPPHATTCHDMPVYVVAAHDICHDVPGIYSTSRPTESAHQTSPYITVRLAVITVRHGKIPTATPADNLAAMTTITLAVSTTARLHTASPAARPAARPAANPRVSRGKVRRQAPWQVPRQAPRKVPRQVPRQISLRTEFQVSLQRLLPRADYVCAPCGREKDDKWDNHTAGAKNKMGTPCQVRSCIGSCCGCCRGSCRRN